MSKKRPIQHTCKHHCLQRRGWSACFLYSRRCVWFPRVSTQLPALRRAKVHSLWKISGFTRIAWQAFFSPCCNTSLIACQYTSGFRRPNSQKHRALRWGSFAGQLTGPPCPTYSPSKVWFRCWQCEEDEAVPNRARTTCFVLGEAARLQIIKQQDGHCTYNVTLRRVRATIVAVEEQ